MYKVLLNPINSKEVYVISTLVHNIEHTTSLYGQPGKLTLTVKKDPLNVLQISCGSRIAFWHNDFPIFNGFIFNIKTDSTGDYKVIAYDQMRYLQNHDYFLIEDMNIQEIFTTICNALKIQYKMLGQAKSSQQKVNKKHFADASYFDMLQYAITETNNSFVTERVYKDDGSFEDVYDPEMSSDKIPICFFIRDNFGILELNDIESNVKYRRTGIDGGMNRAWTGKEWYYYNESLKPELEPLIIGDESLLTNYEYELDIDKDTYNEVYVMHTESDGKSQKTKDGRQIVTSDGKVLGIAKQDKTSLKKYGLLRKIQNVNSSMTDTQLEHYAQILIDNSSSPTRTLKLEALGYNGVNAGDGFLLRLNKLGIESMVYVLSATHHYNADMHTMSLEVCTARNMREVL